MPFFSLTPHSRPLKQIVLIISGYAENYQVLTNFASFSILYFSLFSFVVIFCSILYYWFDESVSESLESLEGCWTNWNRYFIIMNRYHAVIEPLRLAYMETQWGLKFMVKLAWKSVVSTPEQHLIILWIL